MNLGLKGKVAIVMAASKGLGKASARALAMEGANVVIGARDEKILQETAKQLREESKSNILAIPTDVMNPADLKRVVEETVKEFGKIDILVNNAGGPPPGTFETLTDEQWQQTFELTFLSVVRTIRLVLPHMKKTGSGRIINMTGSAVKQPVENLLLSNAIRPGVVGLAKSLANELAAEKITVNNIVTGYFLTDRVNKLYKIEEKLKQGFSEEEAVANRGIPMKRFGKPEEFGALVAFLASDQAAYITGTSIQIDGGLTRSIF